MARWFLSGSEQADGAGKQSLFTCTGFFFPVFSVTQPKPFFISSEGAQQALPSDGELSSGLLETMCARAGSIPLLPLHLARFLRCAMPPPQLLEQIENTARDIAKITIAWPQGARVRLRYGMLNGSQYWDFSVVPLEPVSLWDNGVALYICASRLPPEASLSPIPLGKTRSGSSPDALRGCKLLSRDSYNRAAEELPNRVRAPHGTEPLLDGVMLDDNGYVIEALRSNLLVRKGGKWLTPNLSHCGVRGVMLSWLAGQVEIREDNLTVADLAQADELAVCNSVRGVVPAVRLASSELNRGQPVERSSVAGPATTELQKLITENLW